MKEVKAVRNYRFIEHPIKWFRDIKVMKGVNILLDEKWDDKTIEKCKKAVEEMLLYGRHLEKPKGKYGKSLTNL